MLRPEFEFCRKSKNRAVIGHRKDIHPSGSIYTIIKDAPIAEVSSEVITTILSKFKTSKKVDANYQKILDQERKSKHAKYKEDDPLSCLQVVDIMTPAGETSQNGNEFRGDHPIHGSKNGGNYCINLSKNVWRCYRCNSGGGPGAAIAVKHRIIDCSDAVTGGLRGDLFKEVLQIAKERYLPKVDTITADFEPLEAEDYKRYAEVFNRLRQIRNIFYGRDEPLDIQLSPLAWTHYQKWHREREQEIQKNTTDAIESALWGRLSFYALKLAMLFTVGRSDYKENTTITLEHIQESCRQIDKYFLHTGKLVAEEVAREETTNLINKVSGVLSRNGGKIQWVNLLRLVRQPRKDVRIALDTLVEAEEVSVKVEKKAGKKPAEWIIANRIKRS